MGRLLRLLLGVMARGLRAIAGRLTPIEAVPVAASEPVAVEDTAGGAPGHWLEMVRTRAPGLHMSLQERGIARLARPPAPVVGPTVPMTPSASALEPRGRQSGTAARPAPSAVPAAPIKALLVARPARPMSTAASALSTQRPAEAQPDLEPHTWESAAFDDDHEDWTRVPPRRAVDPPLESSPTTPVAVPAVRRLSAADVAVVETWRSPTDTSPRASFRVRDARAESVRSNLHDGPRRAPTRPELRPLPAAVPVEPVRHSTANPVFAPSRDEDQALHRPVRARVNYPTPSPTPWRIEALQAAADEFAAPRFPSLPDEVPSGAAVRGSVARSATSAPSVPPSSPFFFAHHHHDSSDLIGAWPTLPAARVLALRGSSAMLLRASPEADRWPELLGDETEEGNDPDLSLPAGHRERLEREQRGLSWNG